MHPTSPIHEILHPLLKCIFQLQLRPPPLLDPFPSSRRSHREPKRLRAIWRLLKEHPEECSPEVLGVLFTVAIRLEEGGISDEICEVVAGFSDERRKAFEGLVASVSTIILLPFGWSEAALLHRLTNELALFLSSSLLLVLPLLLHLSLYAYPISSGLTKPSTSPPH